MDFEAYTAWLLAQGVPEPQVQAYRHWAGKIAAEVGGGPILPRHVDEALRRAESQGGTPRQLASLQKIGKSILDFEKTQAAAPPPPPCRDCQRRRRPSSLRRRHRSPASGDRG